ncbi:MAG: chloride channel protein [Spirochaetales bacterium]|uniref:Chloride channel protein n=1 Tax=Candidatus Thalassospirochaeta sargassi TaxID=3119039 RepID=A0AAJ1ILW2_9SPIO|nr:chloride channel protein [Spirochaetales bacterium]
MNQIYDKIKLKHDEKYNLERALIVSLLCILVGIVSGFGAIGFRYLIGFFHNLFFEGKISFIYNSEIPFISRWGRFVVLVPAAGIMIANFITEKWAPEAKGHGVPEVMVAVMEDRGKIRPIVALVKSFASAVTIGAGGSVGREGPIVQIGASFGSTLGQVFKLKTREVIILVSAGVAGSIGATFNAPIGGILFALELILPEYSIMTIMPLVVSSTIATRISTTILGFSPAFILPNYILVSSTEVVFYIVLGILAGLVSILFIRTLYATEDLFNKIKINSNIKALAGGLLLGVTGYLSYRFLGQYYVFGVGYAFLNEVLSTPVPALGVLLLLVVLKIFSNSLTLASGGSGGIFAPSLFLGAAVGAAVGIIVNYAFPNITASPSAYAIVGMAAVVSGTTGASITAIIMIFEMTRNYEIMLPLMLSVVISHFVTAFFNQETIYTKKLNRRGILIQLDKRIPILKSILVSEIMHTDLISCSPSDSITDVLEIMHEKDLGLLPVIENNKVKGTISYNELYHFEGENHNKIKSLINPNRIVVSPQTTLYETLDRMIELKTNILIVTDNNTIQGFITRNRIITSYINKRGRL